jgi:anti-sigma factor RsiW
MKALNCPEVRDLMYLAVCGDLEKEEASVFYSHLATCAACQAALSEHVKLDSMLKDQMPRLFLHEKEGGFNC